MRAETAEFLLRVRIQGAGGGPEAKLSAIRLPLGLESPPNRGKQ